MKMGLIIVLVTSSLFADMQSFGIEEISYRTSTNISGDFLEVPKMKNMKKKMMPKMSHIKKFPEQMEVVMVRPEMMYGKKSARKQMVKRSNSVGFYYSSQPRNYLRTANQGYNHFETMNE
jgi:hypothetical protein